MQVWHRFAGAGAVVHHEAEAFGELEFLGENVGGQQKVAEESFIRGAGFADPGNGLLGNNQQMDRRLWLDVMQHDALFVLVLDPGRNFAGDDFFKKSFHDSSE